MTPQTPPRRIPDAHGLTHRGRVRSSNEDQFVLADLGRAMNVQTSSLRIADDSLVPAPTRAHLLLVADGMGGRPGGDAASTAAAGEASRYVLESMPCRSVPVPDGEILGELGGLVRNCEAAVRALEQADPARKGAGTTLTLAYLQGPRLHVAHVGDSRCYALQGDQLRQLTTDHTLARQLTEDGLLRRRDARRLGYEHVLHNALGAGHDDAEPDLFTVDARRLDAVLLCSDGLTRHVDDDRIATLLKNATSAECACRALVDEAMARGGSDNITVVVAYLTERRKSRRVAEPKGAARRAASRRPLTARRLADVRPPRHEPGSLPRRQIVGVRRPLGLTEAC